MRQRDVGSVHLLRDELSFLSLLVPFWWALSLIILLVLMVVTAFASQVTRHYRRLVVRLSESAVFAGTSLGGTTLSNTSLASTPLSSQARGRGHLDIFWTGLATSSSFAVIFVAAASGVLTLVLPRPLWFPFVIVTLPFFAVWLANRALEGEE